MSLNKTIIMGNLTRDPEMRVTPAGLAITRFTVALNRKFKLQSGEEREEVTYVDIDAFGKQAETVAKFFSKGKAIIVEGRLKTDSWEDKQTGQKRTKLAVVLEAFSFVGQKSEQTAEPISDPSATNEPQQSRPVEGKAKVQQPPVDEDVPF